ncbi:hypothetical protein F4814DRAFT_256987 [Daldinia grandis]|nr:hypothetical protein F4814DRAFT_256987 [Daldinia grandis]
MLTYPSRCYVLVYSTNNGLSMFISMYMPMLPPIYCLLLPTIASAFYQGSGRSIGLTVGGVRRGFLHSLGPGAISYSHATVYYCVTRDTTYVVRKQAIKRVSKRAGNAIQDKVA